MYLVKFAVFLYLCYNLANGISLFSHSDGLNFLLDEIKATTGPFDPNSIETQWIQQPLDHFDTNEKRSWNMKYYQRLDYWKPNGPVFVLLNGNQNQAFKIAFLTGMMFDLATETHGAMFLFEHRYYGESKPFNNYTNENLRYLTSRQALADNARLIEIIKRTKSFSSSKIVVIGGSYGGNLAAWMKLLYPDLVDAAIASSAPVLAKVDFFEYLEILSDVYHKYGTPGCHDKINKIFRRFQKLLTTDEGIKRLKQEQKICEKTDMNKLLNQQVFLNQVIWYFSITAEFGIYSVEDMCKKIDHFNFHLIPSKDAKFDLWNENDQCFDCDFDRSNEYMKTHDDAKPQFYQSCTELGYFNSVNSKNQLFPDNIPVEFFYNWCTAVFGQDFGEKRVNQGVQKTNEMYGGLKPNVTNVVFVNGELDPWRGLSILEDLSNDAPAKVIPYSSHCQDLFTETINDHKELKEARRYIKNLIKKWIGAGEFSNVNEHSLQ